MSTVHARHVASSSAISAAYTPAHHSDLGPNIACVQGDGVVSRVLGGRHWLALGRHGGRWWNLDSSLEAPQLVAPSCNDGGSNDTCQLNHPAQLQHQVKGWQVEQAMAAAGGKPLLWKWRQV
jgi:hypothetical protein